MIMLLLKKQLCPAYSYTEILKEISYSIQIEMSVMKLTKK